MAVEKPTRIGNLDITENAPATISADGWEAFYMDPRVIRTPENLIRNPFSDMGFDESPGGGNPGNNKIPQLADIESVVKTEYVDPATKTTKIKAVIKIRNSSGEELLGVDARVAISKSQGGN